MLKHWAVEPGERCYTHPLLRNGLHTYIMLSLHAHLFSHAQLTHVQLPKYHELKWVGEASLGFGSHGTSKIRMNGFIDFGHQVDKMVKKCFYPL